MKKKELLGMKKLYATDAMLQTAMENRIKVHNRRRTRGQGYSWIETRKESKYGRYFLATVEGNILKVAVFVQSYLEKALHTPIYEIYVDREENRYQTYELLSGKWKTAKISMLDYPDYSYIYYSEDWQQASDRKLVNEYFETGKNLSIYQAVLDFQAAVKEEDLNRKHKNELDQIDSVMRQVPAIPKNFDTWVIKNCFKETLFYEPERGNKWPKMYCTHCQEWMDTQSWPDRPQHGKKTKCPKCGMKAIFRSWNKQKYVEERIDVGILQRLTDDTGYILRNFDCRLKRQHDKGWENLEFTKAEDCRVRLDDHFAEREFFEYGEYKYTGVFRWCHECRRSNWGGYYSQYGYMRSFGKTYMYTPNLKRELKKESFSGMDLKAVFKGGKRERVDSAYILQRLHKYPYLEYLQKSGLTTLVVEILNARERKSLFDGSKQRINEVLKLDKQRFQRLKQWNGGCNVLEVLQYERRTLDKVSDQNIRYIMENEVDAADVMNLLCRTGQNIQRMLNYLERQQRETGQSFGQLLRHYEDYLDMAVGRGMDITDEIVCRQKRLMEYHDRYLEAKNRDSARTRDKIVDNKFTSIYENYKRNREWFSFETDDLVIRVPKKASDITKEGRLQHHCVGASDTYLDRMNRGDSFILFLRKKEDVKTPYYTLEVTWDGEIEQFYAAYDRQPDKKKIEKFLEQFTENIQKRIEGANDLEEGIAVQILAPAAG